MRGADTWRTFAWLMRMTFEKDVLPAYLLLASLPFVALYRRQYSAALRAIAAIILAHVVVLGVLLMGATFYGAAQSYPVLGFVQLAIALGGVGGVFVFTNPLRRTTPRWALACFVVGVAILNLIALFVGGMALANDWV